MVNFKNDEILSPIDCSLFTFNIDICTSTFVLLNRWIMRVALQAEGTYACDLLKKLNISANEIYLYQNVTGRSCTFG